MKIFSRSEWCGIMSLGLLMLTCTALAMAYFAEKGPGRDIHIAGALSLGVLGVIPFGLASLFFRHLAIRKARQREEKREAVDKAMEAVQRFPAGKALANIRYVGLISDQAEEDQRVPYFNEMALDPFIFSDENFGLFCDMALAGHWFSWGEGGCNTVSLLVRVILIRSDKTDLDEQLNYGLSFIYHHVGNKHHDTRLVLGTALKLAVQNLKDVQAQYDDFTALRQAKQALAK